MHIGFFTVSWLAVVVAAVAGLVIGFLWYSPQLFGKRWAAGAGIALPTGTPAPMTLVGTVVLSLLTAYALAVLAGAAGVASATDGAILGFVAWLGFILPWSANSLFFEKKSMDYVAINAGQGLVSVVVMGIIIGLIH